MTYANLAKHPGRVLDQLKIGTVIEIERNGVPVATITGVATSDLPQRSVVECKRTASLRQDVRDGEGVAVTRMGMIEAEIRPVRA
jgi:antitoxin (DNA-binding transcriptional repressor) of toxin-antitoxin stability system